MREPLISATCANQGLTGVAWGLNWKRLEIVTRRPSQGRVGLEMNLCRPSFLCKSYIVHPCILNYITTVTWTFSLLIQG